MSERRSFALKAVVGFCLAILCLAASAQTSPFRFAWLSDTHVGSSTGAEDLRKSVRDINSMTNISFVLLSGDVTEYGSREQLELAKSILDELKVPCHVIPGNHDTKWSESGATDFPRIWKADRFEFEHGGFRFVGMHQGPIMKMGDGHWAPQDVRWLEQTLSAVRPVEQAIVFVTHYPIDEGIANWYVVLDILKQHNTEVVLCGHGHANHQYLFEGVPGVMGRSNLRARAPLGGYNLVDVKEGKMFFSERTPGRTTAPPWHSVVLRRHDYAADTNVYPRPDFSINQRYPGVRARWTYHTGFTIASTPARWNQIAIVGDASGAVYGLALETGAPVWTFHTRGAVYSSPAVSGNRVVFASTDGNIYALDPATGKQQWVFKTERPIVACPSIDRHTVFIGSSEGKFRALELKTGKLVWEFPAVRGFIETKPLVHEGKVIFGAWDEHLYALDAKTGKEIWTWHGAQPGTLFSPAACWPIAAHGKVFIVAPDRKMTALDEATGTQRWRTGEYVVRESIGLSQDRARFYVRSMNDFFYAFSTAANGPQKLWETDGQFGYDINSAMLVEKDGVVFYPTKNGLLFALDGKTGAIRWQHKLGVGVANTILPLSADRVLATDFDGAVVLLEASGKPRS